MIIFLLLLSVLGPAQSHKDIFPSSAQLKEVQSVIKESMNLKTVTLSQAVSLDR